MNSSSASSLPVRRVLRHLFAIGLAALMLACVRARGAAPGPAPDANPTFVFKRFAPGEALHLVAYGDMRFTDPSVTSGTNPRVRRWLAERIAEIAPQAVLLTGDMPFTGAKTEDWEEFQAETAGWRNAHIVELPTPGNHEIYGGAQQGMANYLKNFPEVEGHRYYSALLGNAEVISLDMNTASTPAAPQTRWFAAQLDHLPRQVEFLFILYHIPWMADAQTRLFLNEPSPGALTLRGILEARLIRMRARVVVFNGHLHNYERFERKGVEYVVSGGGGAEPYPLLIRGRADLYRDPGFPVYHYLTIDIAGHKLHAVMWKIKDAEAAALNVEPKDEFTLTAPPPAAAQKPVAKPKR